MSDLITPHDISVPAEHGLTERVPFSDIVTMLDITVSAERGLTETLPA